MSRPRRKVRGFSIFLMVMLAVSVVFFLNFHTVVVTGPSMLPTFKSGQRVLVSSAYWMVGQIRQGDVVVTKGQEGNFLIKRVHRLEGGVVAPHLQPRDVLLGQAYVVPPGNVYLVGDNREMSEDSRTFGPVPREKIIGKVIRW